MVSLTNTKLFLRYIGAMIYDAFLLFGITLCLAMLATALPLLEALLFWLWLISVSVFFTWFWVHGGQTLGMRAWRLKFIHAEKINWHKASWRLLMSVCLLGTGGLAIIFSGRCLQDSISGFKLISY